jgi:pilus assembly protein Flp/PilA
MFSGFKKKMSIKSREEKGASAVEYALIAGLIAVVIIGAVQTLGTDISGVFTDISTKLTSK